MVERKANWIVRHDIQEDRPVLPPVHPIQPPVGCSMLRRARYDQDYTTWMDYSHLVRKGIAKLLTWFGWDVFEPLYVRRYLPSHLTPQELLNYLTEVYAPKELHRRHVGKVKAMVEFSYDPTKPVETYFTTLQQAKDNADLLDFEYSDTQLMFYAMDQLEKQLGAEQAGKIERKWLDLPADTRSWVAFKMFWIKAILRRKYLTTERHDANHAALARTNNDLASAMETVASAMKISSWLRDRLLSLLESTTSMRPRPAPPRQSKPQFLMILVPSWIC